MLGPPKAGPKMEPWVSKMEPWVPKMAPGGSPKCIS